MEQFDLQVMLKDGSFADYIVKTDRDARWYEVFDQEKLLVKVKSGDDGSLTVTENPAGIDPDLENRIREQLKGYTT